MPQAFERQEGAVLPERGERAEVGEVLRIGDVPQERRVPPFSPTAQQRCGSLANDTPLDRVPQLGHGVTIPAKRESHPVTADSAGE